MFSSFDMPSLKTVLIGGAVISGIATVGYFSYKFYFSSEEKFPVNGTFGKFDISPEKREERLTEIARRKAIIDPKQASCVLKTNHCLRSTSLPTMKVCEETTQEKIGETQIANDQTKHIQQTSHDENPDKAQQGDASNINCCKSSQGESDRQVERINKQNDLEQQDVQAVFQDESVKASDQSAKTPDNIESSGSKSLQQKDNNSFPADTKKVANKLGKEYENDEEKEEMKLEEKQNGEAEENVDETVINPQEERQGQENEALHPLVTETASGSHSTNQPMPGLYIPSILKNVKTLKDLEQTMEALSIFLFTTNRTREELDEAKKELGWVFDFAKGFYIHRIPELGIPFAVNVERDHGIDSLEDEDEMEPVD